MAMVSAVVASMAAFYHDTTDIDDPRHREIFAHRIIAKLPTIAAAAYKHTLGQPFIYPRNDLRYCANMLNMFFAVPCEPYAIDPVAAEAMDLLFILHADHEQNASTSTVRLAGSTGANPYAAISAGVSALWGPAHGGANEAVLDMLDGIGSAANIDKFLARVKDKSDSVRLMGFGHRVYKNFDPRAKIIREMCYRVLEKLGKGNNPLFDLALKLEEIALKDEYFVSRKLYPNVDFYSGIIYSALGIPRSMFTVLFAIARTAGWVAHWQEMVSDPHMRIGRPRQLYTGPTQRDYLLDRQALMAPHDLARRPACPTRVAAVAVAILTGFIACGRCARRCVRPTSRRPPPRPATPRRAGQRRDTHFARSEADPVALGSAQWNGWGRESRQHALPARTRDPRHRCAQARAQMGVWLPRRAGRRTAHPGRRAPVRRERVRPHLLARCQERLHLLDL